MGTVDRTTTRVAGFATGEMDFQLMRSLGACTSGGGSPGEIMAARARIDGDQAEQWPQPFAELAEACVNKADVALAKGQARTACKHLLRASSYYRSSEYFSDPFTADARRYGLASEDAFRRAAEHLPFRVASVEIPFESVRLRGYLMCPPGVSGPNKTVVCLTGFDGTAEELYFQTAAEAVERGYSVLVAEGPGQMGTMRHNPDLVFRPDYETPIAAIIDFALAQSEVDGERLGLYGISFGGYFVTRAAIHDRRIRALVVNSPIIDLQAYMSGFMGPGASEELRLDEVDDIPAAMMPAAMKLSFKWACLRFGAQSLHQWLERLSAYRADNLAAIACPSLALVGTGEGAEALRQSEVFSKEVTGPVTQRVFEVEEGADMHCQLGNLPLSNAVIYDWLDEVLA